MKDFEVCRADKPFQTLGEYDTREAALTAAILAWDAQEQTGDPIRVISYTDCVPKQIALFKDQERAVIEGLIPAIEQANDCILEHEISLEARFHGDYTAEEWKSYNQFLDQMEREMHLVAKAFNQAGLYLHITRECVDVSDFEWVKHNYPDVTELDIELFVAIRVGRWLYELQSHKWTRFDVRL